jgi:hypothetical protein
MGLKLAFEAIRTQLNDALVPTTFSNPMSMAPKHPDLALEDGDTFPYWGIKFAGFAHDYEGSDQRWTKPSQRLAQFNLWLCIKPSDAECLSVDMMTLVETVEAAVAAVSANRGNSFRVRTQSGEAEFDPADRWGMIRLQLVVGAYGT